MSTGRQRLRAVEESSHTRRNGSDPTGKPTYKVTIKDGKLQLPKPPEHGNMPALCAWLTCAFNLDRRHPITRGERQGPPGPQGHVVLRRADAPDIRFEPASRMNTPGKLIETLCWHMLPSDGAIFALKSDHCREVTYVTRMLCGAHESLVAAQEAAAIVGDLMQMAEPVEGATTYGTSGQRYEAAVALRRKVDEMTGRRVGPRRCLIDASTGEFVVAIVDLQEAARHHIGSSLERGWLDSRMAELGWERVRLDGHQLPGRAGRQGPHARVDAYRGLLPSEGSLDPEGTHDGEATVTA